jgi:hypothetical protein
VQQRVELKRLGDEVRRAVFDCFDGIFHGPVAGDDDRDDVGIALDRCIEHLAAVDARKPKVGQDDVEGELREPLQRVFAAASLLDQKIVIGEPLRDCLTQRHFVVDDQQMFPAFRHLSEWAVF